MNIIFVITMITNAIFFGTFGFAWQTSSILNMICKLVCISMFIFNLGFFIMYANDLIKVSNFLVKVAQ